MKEGTYNLSTDYEKAYELLKSGAEFFGFGKTFMGITPVVVQTLDKPEPCIHINAGVESQKIRLHAKDTFIEQCTRLSLEYIPPTPTLDQVMSEVDAEPELPGPMPDEMWTACNGDRDATQEAMRIVVRLTKEGIRTRLKTLGLPG